MSGCEDLLFLGTLVLVYPLGITRVVSFKKLLHRVPSVESDSPPYLVPPVYKIKKKKNFFNPY